MTVPFFSAYPSEPQVPNRDQELEDYQLPAALSDAANFVWASLRPPSPDPSEPPGFKWIDGRGFKEDGNPAYCLPNDPVEADRLNKQHHDIKVMAQVRFPILHTTCGMSGWMNTHPRASFSILCQRFTKLAIDPTLIYHRVITKHPFMRCSRKGVACWMPAAGPGSGQSKWRANIRRARSWGQTWWIYSTY